MRSYKPDLTVNSYFITLLLCLHQSGFVLHLNVDMQSRRPQSDRTMNRTEQDRQSKFLSESESSVVSSCTSICVHAYPANCACVQGPVQSLSLVSYQWRSLDSAHCYETVFISNESSWVPSSGRG